MNTSTIQGPDTMVILVGREPQVLADYSEAHEDCVYLRIPQHVSLEKVAADLKSIAKQLPELFKQFESERNLSIGSIERVAKQMLEQLPPEMHGMRKREQGEAITAFVSLARARIPSTHFDDDIPF